MAAKLDKDLKSSPKKTVKNTSSAPKASSKPKKQLEEDETDELEDDEQEAEGQVLEINFHLGMAVAFAQRSKAVVNAGRLPCPFCAIPIDPKGHLCPRANGYRR